MSDDDRVAHLEGKLEAQAELMAQLQQAQSVAPAETTMEASGKLFRWLTPLLSIVIVIIGLGINWGVTKTKLEVQAALNLGTAEKISKVEDDVHELQLKQATTSPVIAQIQKDVSEIKQDVKTLAGLKQ